MATKKRKKKKSESPGDWRGVSDTERRSLLSRFEDNELAQTFVQDEAFFARARAFYDRMPVGTSDSKPTTHPPPKSLITNARRDLNFTEANFELFDNAIDSWRRRGISSPLDISVFFDLDANVGYYKDNAGGIFPADVYKVFIPGATTNTDFSEPMIGSFGMGAKKAIFRISDGAKVVSSVDGKSTATSEVPADWDKDPDWRTNDGTASPIDKGTTEIFFLQLFSPPSEEDIIELRKRTSTYYAPLLKGGYEGEIPISITINGAKIEPPAPIPWSGAKGVEPTLYRFSKVFPNFLNSGQGITLEFDFVCGLTRRGPQQDGVSDWGVEAYGNGRLIESGLKKPFGFGTRSMSLNRAAAKYVYGQLYIKGHSFAIPWDTHKREYMRDHEVARFLRKTLRPILKSYLSVATRFGSAGYKELRKKYLAGVEWTDNPLEVELDEYLGDTYPEEILASYEYGKPDADDDADDDADNDADDDGETEPEVDEDDDINDDTDDTDGDLEVDEEEGEVVVQLVLEQAVYDSLMARFSASDLDELQDTLADVLTNGIAFDLSSEDLENALKLLECERDELSDVLKEQFLAGLSEAT